MELTTVHGKQMSVGPSLKTYAQDKIGDIITKYINHPIFANVTFSPEGHGHKQTRAHIIMKLGDILINAESTEAEPYVAFDAAAEKASKQLRRYKRRLRDHHERKKQTPESEILKARDYVLAVQELEEDHEPIKGNGHNKHHEPVVIAEMATTIETLTVSDAVMRLELADLPVLMFRNAKHNGLSLVYKRPDGNVGWIDPEG